MHYFLFVRAKNVIAFMLLTLLFAVQFAYAQTTTVTGKVTDQSSGAPLGNVTVLVKGTSNGTTTGNDGGFSIAIPNRNAVLVFSYIGYGSREVPVGNNTSLNVQMSAGASQLGDVV